MIGSIVAVRREVGGAGLVVAASSGDLSLSVDWSIDFTPGERRLLMIGTSDSDNETLAYTDVDDDTDVLTIEPPGVVLPWEIGDPVTPLDPTGLPEETWLIDVDMGDDGGPIPCRPSHALQDKLREDEDYVGIRCEVVGGEVVTLVDKASSIEPSAYQAPLFVGYLPANQPIPTVTYTTLTGWTVRFLRGGMQYDVATGAVVVPLSGMYSISDSAVTWAASTAGRRGIQATYNTAAGAVLGAEFRQDASNDPTSQTLPMVTPLMPLEAGESVILRGWQNTGGSLDVQGSALGTLTFFSVEYRGPL